MFNKISEFLSSDTTRRYIFSSVQTFLAAFLASLAFSVKELTLEGLTGAAVAGAILTAFRVGVKAAWEIAFPK